MDGPCVCVILFVELKVIDKDVGSDNETELQLAELRDHVPVAEEQLTSETLSSVTCSVQERRNRDKQAIIIWALDPLIIRRLRILISNDIRSLFSET